MLVGELVRDAYLELRVIDAQAPVSAQKMTDAIRKLNQIMSQDDLVGRSLGWSPVERPDDPLPVPPEHENFVTLFLAISLQGRHKTPLDPTVVAGFNKAKAALTSAVLVNSVTITDSPDLPYGTGQRDVRGWRAGFVG